jgi:hypothetical protein
MVLPLRAFRVTSGVALVAYLWAALAAPMLHRVRHLTQGADHVHTPVGTVPLHPHRVDEVHQSFDADLAALDLAEAATAGTLAIDCGLAAYTLAECVAPSDHPRRFGDQLRHRAPAPIDFDHGAGSPEHLGAFLLVARAFVLPPPARPLIFVLSAQPLRTLASQTRFTHAPRGPPGRFVL